MRGEGAIVGVFGPPLLVAGIWSVNSLFCRCMETLRSMKRYTIRAERVPCMDSLQVVNWLQGITFRLDLGMWVPMGGNHG